MPRKEQYNETHSLVLLSILIWGQSCDITLGNVSIVMVLWQKYKESHYRWRHKSYTAVINMETLVPIGPETTLLALWNLYCPGPLRSPVLRRGVHNESQRYYIQGSMA